MIKTIAAVGASTLALMAGSASAQEWQGFYAGGFAGFQNHGQDGQERIRFDNNLDGTFGDTVMTAPIPAIPAGPGVPAVPAVPSADAFSPGFCNGSPNGNAVSAGCSDDSEGSAEFGVRAGYDWQRGSMVFGVLAEFSAFETEDSVTAFSVTPARYTFKREVENLAAARLRVGFTSGRFLPYLTVGYAAGTVNDTFATSNTANSFTPVKNEQDANGYQLGGGIETKITERFSVGLEYLYTSLDADSLVVRTGPGTAPATNPFLRVNAAGTDQRRENDDVDLYALRVTGSFRF